MSADDWMDRDSSVLSMPEASRPLLVNDEPTSEDDFSDISSNRTRSMSRREMDQIEVENKLYQAELRAQKRFHRKLQQFWGWILIAIIGVATGLTAFSVGLASTQLADLKYKLTVTTIHACDGCIAKPFFIILAFNVVFVLVSAFMVIFWEPAAGGSGIPQIKGYLNGIRVPNIVRAKTFLVKVVGVVLAISGGLIVGKAVTVAAPMVHSGAILAAGFIQGQPLSLGSVLGKRITKLNLGVWGRYRSDQFKRDFVAAGVAAGISASFGAPLGGLLFAIEDSASFWRQKLIWKICLCGSLSAFTLNFLLSGQRGHWGVLIQPGLIVFGNNNDFVNGGYAAWHFPFFIIVAVLGGVLGSMFVGMSVLLHKMRNRFIRTPVQKIMEVLLVVTITTVATYFMPIILKSCKDKKDLGPTASGIDYSHFTFYCPQGTYNQMATLFFASQESTMTDVLSQHRQFDTWELLSFLPFHLFLACITNGMSVPGGLFVPGLVGGEATIFDPSTTKAGAVMGRLLGEWISTIVSDVEPVVFAMLGAASVLAGIFRTPISLTAIIIEATHSERDTLALLTVTDIGLSLPVFFVVFISKWIGDFFDSGIYNSVYRVIRYPVLNWDPPSWSQWLEARHVMQDDVITMRTRESVKNIIRMLRDTTHNGFPVVRDDEKFVGIILRSQLTLLLTERAFVRDRDDVKNQKVVPLDKFREEYPRFPSIDDVTLSEEDIELSWMDLEPYINLHPYTVHSDTSFGRVFRLFRSMGLRHLCVVDEANHVVGIITRKDLAYLDRKQWDARRVRLNLSLESMQ
ncbi:hypothetical protein PROFUN_12485 [Planoprotostelium fungivorum]|uniref:Chloride channel protein n=1 Tax=Planoprotostelium fungivorum TaxID=1890364 RepID=A0A2P6N797_9EUKA|nr:hypothetical protein PROFUN_12485 [Planoprotostelium fungivorum]